MKNRITSLLLLAAMGLSCLFMMVSCDTNNSTTSTTAGTTATAQSTTEPSPSIDKAKALADVIAAITASAPKSSETQMTYTTQWGDVLNSTFSVKENGTCDYSIQEFAVFTPGSSPEDPIVTTTGTADKNSVPEEAVSLGKLNLKASILSSFEATKDSEGVVTLTAHIKDDSISIFLTKKFDAVNMTATFAMNSANKIIAVEIEYTTPNEATVRQVAQFAY